MLYNLKSIKHTEKRIIKIDDMGYERLKKVKTGTLFRKSGKEKSKKRGRHQPAAMEDQARKSV